jgi:hypothetical protein
VDLCACEHAVALILVLPCKHAQERIEFVRSDVSVGDAHTAGNIDASLLHCRDDLWALLQAIWKSFFAQINPRGFVSFMQANGGLAGICGSM